MILDGSTFRAQSQEPVYLWAMARDSANAGVTGLIEILVSVVRMADGYYWNAINEIFQAAPASTPLTEYGGGLYFYLFTPHTDDFMVIMYSETLAAPVVNSPFIGEIVFGNWVDNLDAAITSRGSAETADVVKARIGAAFIDDNLTRLHSLYAALKAEVKENQEETVKKLDTILKQINAI